MVHKSVGEPDKIWAGLSEFQLKSTLRLNSRRPETGTQMCSRYLGFGFLWNKIINLPFYKISFWDWDSETRMYFGYLDTSNCIFICIVFRFSDLLMAMYSFRCQLWKWHWSQINILLLIIVLNVKVLCLKEEANLNGKEFNHIWMHCWHQRTRLLVKIETWIGKQNIFTHNCIRLNYPSTLNVLNVCHIVEVQGWKKRKRTF